MSFGTKGKGSKKSVSKTLSPGNRKCKINSVTLEEDKFSDGVYISLQVEGEKLENFDGFWRDPQDQSQGKYEGQVGKVQSGMFPFKPSDYNGTTKSISEQVLDFFIRLADESGVRAQVDAIVVEDEGKTEIEVLKEYTAQVSPILAKGKFLNLLIGGKEYTNKQNYSAYILFIAKPDKGKVSIESADVTPADSRLTTFDNSNVAHMKLKKKAQPVEGFDGGLGGDAGDELALS